MELVQVPPNSEFNSLVALEILLPIVLNNDT